MDPDIIKITMRIDKLKTDYANETSDFRKKPDIQSQMLKAIDDRVEAIGNRLLTAHKITSLDDFTLSKTWDRIKAAISTNSKLSDLETLKTQVNDVARDLLSPSQAQEQISTAAPPPPGAPEDLDLLASIADDEARENQTMEALKKWFVTGKPNLRKTMDNLAKRIVDGEYGEEIKDAALNELSLVLEKQSFLRLLLVEDSFRDIRPHSLHEAEWNISEENKNKLVALKAGLLQTLATESWPSKEEWLALIQKTSNSTSPPLSAREDALFKYLNAVIECLDISKREEKLYSKLLCKKSTIFNKIREEYTAATQIQDLKGRTQALKIAILRYGSLQPKLFFEAFNTIITDRKGLDTELLTMLKRELKRDPRIIKDLPQNSVLQQYLIWSVSNETLKINVDTLELGGLMLPHLLETDPPQALGLVNFFIAEALKAYKAKRLIILPTELFQMLVQHNHLKEALQVSPFVPVHDAPQCAIELVHLVSSEKKTAIVDTCRKYAYRSIAKLLDMYIKTPNPETAAQAKLKIIRMLDYLKKELSEFLPVEEFEHLEFTLLEQCAETTKDPRLKSYFRAMLIPEFVRLGRKDAAIAAANKILESNNSNPLEKNDNWNDLFYSLLKASGLEWEDLDLYTFGPLLKPQDQPISELDTDLLDLSFKLLELHPNPASQIPKLSEMLAGLQDSPQINMPSFQNFIERIKGALNKALNGVAEELADREGDSDKVYNLFFLAVGFGTLGEGDSAVEYLEQALGLLPNDEVTPEEISEFVIEILKLIKTIHRMQNESSSGEPNRLESTLIEKALVCIRHLEPPEARILRLINIPSELDRLFYRDDALFTSFSDRSLECALEEIKNLHYSQQKEMLDLFSQLTHPLSNELLQGIEVAHEAIELAFEEYEDMRNELVEFQQHLDSGSLIEDLSAKIDRCIEIRSLRDEPDICAMADEIFDAFMTRVSPEEQSMYEQRKARAIEEPESGDEMDIDEEEDAVDSADEIDETKKHGRTDTDSDDEGGPATKRKK